jgi:2-phosphoglycolate phosphatase
MLSGQPMYKKIQPLLTRTVIATISFMSESKQNENKNTHIAAVLFDLDGTLMNTAPDFYTTLHILCDRHQVKRLSEQEIRENVSDGSRALTRLCFPNVDSTTQAFEALRLELLRVYEDEVGKASVLFPEISDIINYMDDADIPWGIVTNKPRLYTELLLQRTELAQTCKVLVCADDLKKAKPDPEGILKACETLAVKPEQCIYVGDHERDIIAGKAAGCPTAIVSFGYFEDGLDYSAWGADYEITSLDSFVAAFTQNR